MSLTYKPSIPAQVMARQAGEETVILDVVGGTCYGLDPVGARIWQLMHEGKTLGEICGTMMDEYEVTRDALGRDVVELADNLLGQKLISTE